MLRRPEFHKLPEGTPLFVLRRSEYDGRVYQAGEPAPALETGLLRRNYRLRIIGTVNDLPLRIREQVQSVIPVKQKVKDIIKVVKKNIGGAA